MTSFSDMVFSQGVPLAGHGIPATFGTTYFVDADNGSDGNSGLKMNEAKATVLAAYMMKIRSAKYRTVDKSCVM